MRINLIIFIVNFEHVFVSWAQDKNLQNNLSAH